MPPPKPSSRLSASAGGGRVLRAAVAGKAPAVKLLWLIYAACVAITVGLVVIVVLAFTSVSGQ
jgi:hypothetical protein